MSNKLMLHELTGEYLKLSEMFFDDSIDESALYIEMDKVKGEINVKMENYAIATQNMAALAKSMKDAEEKINARRKKLEDRIENIKSYIKHNMDRLQIHRISSPYLNIQIKNNPPSVRINNEDQIPSEYMVQPEPQPMRPDKRKMLEDLKQGVVIDGAELVQTTRLEIK